MDFVVEIVVKGASNLVSHHNTFKPRRPEKREEKWSKQFWRSNSLPTSRRFSVVNNGDPSITFLDDTNIQIIIESDSVPRQKVHESTPVKASSDANSIAVNESCLKRELYAYALTNTWDRAKSIYDEFPDMVRIPLTARGDTALHVAASIANNSSSTFVKGLVNLEYMTPKDLEIPNVDGNTAFCIAAITGNGDLFQIMIDKNEKLPIIPGHDGMLPVHLAALTGYHEIVQQLSSDDLLQKMDFKDIQLLFFMTINSSMYDVATKLVEIEKEKKEKDPEKLVVARYDDKDQLTALHMLARKPSEEFYMRENSSKETSSGWGHQLELELFKKLWSQVRQLEYNMMMELITDPSVVLFDAVKWGNVEAVKWLLYMNRELLTISENGLNLLHFAALYRRRRLFHFIIKMGTVNLVIRAVDKDRNNVLHFAAHHQPEEASSTLRPNIQMLRALLWFEEAEKSVPSELRTMRNIDGKTPEDIFYAKHMKLSNEAKESAKVTAKSGMVVATLVATVAFAAALTVPGDKSSATFKIFILTNAVALFTSSASMVSFLSIFITTRFTEREFMMSLHLSLFIGLFSLFISIITMILAFAVACDLIFDHISTRVASVVTLMGILLILMIHVKQSSFQVGLLYHLFNKENDTWTPKHPPNTKRDIEIKREK